jgi:hypothetical protein
MKNGEMTERSDEGIKSDGGGGEGEGRMSKATHHLGVLLSVAVGLSSRVWLTEALVAMIEARR